MLVLAIRRVVASGGELVRRRVVEMEISGSGVYVDDVVGGCGSFFNIRASFIGNNPAPRHADIMFSLHNALGRAFLKQSNYSAFCILAIPVRKYLSSSFPMCVLNGPKIPTSRG